MDTKQENPKARAAGRPVTPLWVISVGVAILMLLGATAFLAKPRGKDLDAAETASSLFEAVSAPVPFGLSLEGARELPSKEVVVTYAADADAPREGDEPLSLTIMEFPRSRAESVLEEQFTKLKFSGASMSGGRGRGRGGRGRGRPSGGDGEGQGKGKGGGSDKPTLQDAGFMDWHGYSANYARLRHSAKDSKESYDTVRVNLSTAGRCIIGYIRFPDGAEGSKARSEELFAAFEPRETSAVE